MTWTKLKDRSPVRPTPELVKAQILANQIAANVARNKHLFSR